MHEVNDLFDAFKRSFGMMYEDEERMRVSLSYTKRKSHAQRKGAITSGKVFSLDGVKYEKEDTWY